MLVTSICLCPIWWEPEGGAPPVLQTAYSQQSVLLLLVTSSGHKDSIACQRQTQSAAREKWQTFTHICTQALFCIYNNHAGHSKL